MICFIENRPVLQVGRQQVTGYGTEWLRKSIQQGAAAAEREDFPFIDDLIKGIQLYLEHKCPLQLLTIEDLHAKVRKMLTKIGCESIAQNLPLLAPPVTISLQRIARELENRSEGAFFAQLRSEIEDLRAHGVEDLSFTDTRSCVKILLGVTEWSTDCEPLHAKVLSFLNQHGKPTMPTAQEIRLHLI